MPQPGTAGAADCDLETVAGADAVALAVLARLYDESALTADGGFTSGFCAASSARQIWMNSCSVGVGVLRRTFVWIVLSRRPARI